MSDRSFFEPFARLQEAFAISDVLLCLATIPATAGRPHGAPQVAAIVMPALWVAIRVWFVWSVRRAAKEAATQP